MAKLSLYAFYLLTCVCVFFVCLFFGFVFFFCFGEGVVCFYSKLIFKKIFLENKSKCKRVWIYIRPEVLSGLISVRTTCKRLVI